MADQPTVDDVLAYMRTPNLDDDEREQVAQALAAAQSAQSSECVWGVYDDALRWACLRRTARTLAARSSPLGFVSELGDFGPATLRQMDVEIESFERPYRLAPTVVS